MHISSCHYEKLLKSIFSTQKPCNSSLSCSVLTIAFKAAQDQTPLLLWFPSLHPHWPPWCFFGILEMVPFKSLCFSSCFCLEHSPGIFWSTSRHHLLNEAYFDQLLPPFNIATCLFHHSLDLWIPIYPALHFFSSSTYYLLICCIILIVLIFLYFTTSCVSGGTLSVLLTITFQVPRTVPSIQ